MHNIIHTKRKRAVLGLFTAVVLLLSLTGCHLPGHTTIDKNYAKSDVQTGTYDADEGAWVTVEVKNKTGGPIRVEISANDGVPRSNAIFTIASCSDCTSFTPFGSPSSMSPSDPDYAGPPIEQGPNVDIWIKVSDPGTGQTLEWHHHDNVVWGDGLT